MKVKICGLKKAVDVKAAVENGADMIGFVFAKSRRQVTIEQAHELAKNIPANVKKVGVFVNPTEDELTAAIKGVPLDVVQLHGQEPAEQANRTDAEVIKAFPVKDGKLPDTINDYPNAAVLLDAPAEEYEGGSGKTFDWDKIDRDKLLKNKLIIAGGLNAENVQEAIKRFEPYAVDISSGVETNGEKDPEKIKTFIKTAKGVEK
ncbi:phosphoribosylanthranilate isomerase [Listeria swaminathanii]|uniref:N-(5'-phosphoribosyl)anthranilate isomerase n=1 Tax=Listeria swaminathanii TaxID=2713501 RepID=A0ABU2IBV4_9LIST|nr:phosphoribosylanthranilate isomerase [Listeria swaminathanii]UHP09109.1 phosphoribosylanthranilate isomerase [Listeria marthii]MDT0016911.1 phosphoribosylanthranilate isomerase [Listeria swaminathanii]MDT0022347.1 phosphoribosylanthranilate isomerase [Listeria swaminathanii]MDT0033311.1 phosphoribosylanthranilate isomerase [Listeria swaminathanii]MDT0050839.1 phosphoribosylanthranilate isomerase [Listeria swaminathanii]